MPVQIPLDTIEYDFIDSSTQLQSNISQKIVNQPKETVLNSNSVQATNSSFTFSLLRISSSNSTNFVELEYDQRSQDTKINISIVGISLSISSIFGLIIYIIKLKNTVIKQINIVNNQINNLELENMPDSFDMAPFTATINNGISLNNNQVEPNSLNKNRKFLE
jgi:hypothetical protein